MVGQKSSAMGDDSKLAMRQKLHGMALKRAQRKRKIDTRQCAKSCAGTRLLPFGSAYKPAGGTVRAPKRHAGASAKLDASAREPQPGVERVPATIDAMDALLKQVASVKYPPKPFAEAGTSAGAQRRWAETEEQPIDFRAGGIAALPTDWTLKESVVLRSSVPLTPPAADAEAECTAVLCEPSASACLDAGATAGAASARAHMHYRRALMYWVYPGDTRASDAVATPLTGTKPAAALMPQEHQHPLSGSGASSNARPVPTGAATMAGHAYRRLHWEEAFRSAYLMLRHGHTSCLYLLCPTASTTVLFARHRTDASCSVRARATRMAPAVQVHATHKVSFLRSYRR